MMRGGLVPPGVTWYGPDMDLLPPGIWCEVRHLDDWGWTWLLVPGVTSLRPGPPSTATQYAALQPGSGGRGGRGSAGETSVTPAPPGGQYHQRQSHWHQSSIAIDHHQSKITSDTCTSTRVVSPLTINQVLRPVTTTKAESSMTPAAPERCHLFVEMPEVTLGRTP